MKKLILMLPVAIASFVAYASQNHLVGQKDKAFSAETLTIKVGDSVEFRNDDPYFHNVYSLSDLKTFDLGSYAQGDSRTVTFEEAGVVDVECAIHPNMLMTITIED